MTLSTGASIASFGGDQGARTARLMVYALIATILMVLDYRGGYVAQVRDWAANLIEPAILVVEAPFAFGRRMGEELRSRHTLQDTIALLERKLHSREARLMLLEELRSENMELRQLLEASDRLDVTFRAAELMSIDLNPYSHRVMINRGRRDGLEEGQPVLDAEGVIGQVDRVARNSAQVILISDPDHALPVRVQRTDLRTVAYGSGQIDSLRLSDLPMNVDLEPGDVLITSGLGGAFPPGLPVAEIRSVQRRAGEPFARAEARPIGRLDRARHVLVVVIESQSDDPEVATEESAGDYIEAEDHIEEEP